MKLGKAKQRQGGAGQSEGTARRRFEKQGKGLAQQQIAVAWHGRDKKNGDLQWLCSAKQRLSYKQTSDGEAFLGKAMAMFLTAMQRR